MDNRELVVRVATEVMEWRLLAGDTWIDEKNKIAHPFFRPDTDIAAALPVLEKWTDAEIEKAGGNYRVTLIGAPIVTADAETLPLAICLAALKAMEDK